MSNITNRLENLGKRMSEKDIKIYEHSQSMTDGKSIYLPYKREKWETLTGLLGHESFHIRAHTFQPCILELSKILSSKYNISQEVVHMITNIIEDYRVNTWLKRTFKVSYNRLHNYFIELLEKAILIGKKPNTLLQYNTYLGSIEDPKTLDMFMKSNIFDLNEEETKELEKIAKDIRNNPSPEQGATSAIDLLKLYLKRRNEEVKNNQNSQESQGLNDQLKKINDELKRLETEKSLTSDIWEGNKLQGQINQKREEGTKIENEISEKPTSQSSFDQKITKDQKSDKIKNVPNIHPNPNNKKEQAIKSSTLSTAAKKIELEKAKENAKMYEQTYGSEKREQLLEDFKKQVQIEEKKLEAKLEKAKERTEKEITNISKPVTQKKEEKPQIFKSGRASCVRITKDLDKYFSSANTLISSKIIKENKSTINNLRKILGFKNIESRKSRGNRTGRMNRDIIRTVASNYQNQKCFSKITQKAKGKMMIIIDLSGSMRGNRIELTKKAITIIAESTKNIVDLRIVGFREKSGNAYTFVFKEFDEPLDYKKLDYINENSPNGGTPDGIAVETEVNYLTVKNTQVKKIPVLVITDGGTSFSKQSQEEATQAFIRCRRKVHLFGISIVDKQYDIEQRYGNNYTIISDEYEIEKKLINIARKVVSKI